MTIPYDKKLHFLAGLGFSILFGIWAPLYGLLAAIAAGIAKEIYDYLDYEKCDFFDMLATWLGGIVGFGVMIILHQM